MFYRLSELLEPFNRSIGQNDLLKQSQRGFHLNLCCNAAHSKCGKFVFQPGCLVGMKEEIVIYQQAQDQASACPSSPGCLVSLLHPSLAFQS
jgi:hypothetical protein